MAVVIETTLGDITVDLFVEQRPTTCLNFLKLCKMKYYNFNLFHTIQSGFIAQTGDPSGEGSGGQSIWGLLEGNNKRFFSGEKMPKIRHSDAGLLSMVSIGDMMIGSQFFFTLGADLDSLDGVHCVIGAVTEGHEVLRKLNDTICDETHRPYQDVRITHTVILEDPFNDPPALKEPSRSPSPSAERLKGGRIAPDEDIDDLQGKSAVEIQEMIEEKEAKARATILEIIGDLPDADIAPPENVLFVCKLNPVTSDEDLEIIFSRFGKIVSCEVIRDKKSGDSLQYAFIEFADQKSCEDAYFKMDNVLIDDRRIHVDFSQSVSKIKWLGKGRGVKHIKDDGNKNQMKNRSGRSRSRDRRNDKKPRESEGDRERENRRDHRKQSPDHHERRNHREERRRSRSRSRLRKDRDREFGSRRHGESLRSRTENDDQRERKDNDRGNRSRNYGRERSTERKNHRQTRDGKKRERSVEDVDELIRKSRDKNKEAREKSQANSTANGNDHRESKVRDKSIEQINTERSPEPLNERHSRDKRRKASESDEDNEQRDRRSEKPAEKVSVNDSYESRREISIDEKNNGDSRDIEKGLRNGNKIAGLSIKEKEERKTKNDKLKEKGREISPKQKDNTRNYEERKSRKETDRVSNDEEQKQIKDIKSNNSKEYSSKETRKAKKETSKKEKKISSNKKKEKQKKICKSKNVKKKRMISTSSSSSETSETSTSSSSSSSSSSDSDARRKRRKRKYSSSSSSDSSTTTTSSSTSSSSDSSAERRRKSKKTAKKIKKK